MTKVLSVFGTRPEAIKMAPVVRALEAEPGIRSTRVCVTGQHRQMLDQILGLWQIEPDYDLDIMRPGQTLTNVTSAVLEGLAKVIERETPDWLLVQGDTTTAMAASLSGFYHGISVGHVEAGLRTWDVQHPFPEELNRRITGLVSDLHFAPTAWAATNLKREGVPATAIHVTGNTVVDAFRHVAALPFDPSGTPLADIPADKRLIVATCHRRENFGRGIEQVCRALRHLASTEPDVHIVMPVHPNPRVHGPAHRALGDVPSITLLPPLDYQPMVRLLARCHVLITDSGGLQEEATGVGKPCLVLRTTTERPEGVQAGTAKLVGADAGQLLSWCRRLLHDGVTYQEMSQATNPYGNGRAAPAIARLLAEPARVIDLAHEERLAAEAYDAAPTREFEPARVR